MTVPMLAALFALAGAAICLGVLIEPRWSAALDRSRESIQRRLAIERVRQDLTQAGIEWLAPSTWIALRLGVSVAVGLVAYVLFHVVVLGLVGCVASYHLSGLALEHRRRERQFEHQQALLEAVRYGSAVMSRGGSASDMLRALARNGPGIVRPIFTALADEAEGAAVGIPLPVRVAALREHLADPLFDDVALALALHWQQGARLVPALDAVVQDWSESVRLQREAKSLRAGVEASVLILTLLPAAFVTLLQLLAPRLLHPFRTPVGEAILGAAAAWMVLGYRVLQRMSEPPREERLRLRRGSP